jgi:hypothetical protein
VITAAIAGSERSSAARVRVSKAALNALMVRQAPKTLVSSAGEAPRRVAEFATAALDLCHLPDADLKRAGLRVQRRPERPVHAADVPWRKTRSSQLTLLGSPGRFPTSTTRPAPVKTLCSDQAVDHGTLARQALSGSDRLRSAVPDSREE